MNGIGVSHGIGIGNVCIIADYNLDFVPAKITNTAAELIRLKNAIAQFNTKTESMAQSVKQNIGTAESDILIGQITMLSDPSMHSEMENSVNHGTCSELAVSNTCNKFINIFSNAEDELLRQRATDVNDIRTRLLTILLGIDTIDIGLVPPNTILVAKELTPSMTSQIVKSNVVGIITETGGKTSHSAILARALEIPAILSADNITSLVNNNDTIIVDGSNGDIFVNPDNITLQEYKKRQYQYIQALKSQRNLIGKPTVTGDGTQLEILCNIGTPVDANQVLKYDGEGIGLFRTEFLFMDNTHVPDEEEQFNAYRTVVDTMSGRPVTIRTLDVGGDKDIPYLEIPKEENPFLGYRAIRYCLGNPSIYRVQLKALLRASAYGTIKIMIPLITCIDELRAVKLIIHELKMELDANHIPYDNNIAIGVMIETPSAVMIADTLAREADFFSIGTNDLTQYTMSVDRGNSQVAYLYSAFQPSVLRAIRYVINCANNAGIPVGMCGEAAADYMMIPLLIAWGLDEFSVNPVLVLGTRELIMKWETDEAQKVASKVMEMDTEKNIIEYLKNYK